MKNCRNCHFLTKSSASGGAIHSFALRENERDVIATDTLAIENNYSLSCHKGVWDEGVDPSIKNERDLFINKFDRNDFCFYFPSKRGMLFKAAEELQKREQHVKQVLEGFIYTRISIYVATIALIANFVFKVVHG